MKGKIVCMLVFLSTLTRTGNAENNVPPFSDPVSLKEFNLATIIGQDLDVTATFKAIGMIAPSQADHRLATETYRLVITEAHETDQAGAYIIKTDNKQLKDEASELLPTIIPSQLITNKLFVGKVPCDSPKIADFTLFITVRAFGQIMHSDNRGTHFHQEGCWFSGMAEIAYDDRPAPNDTESVNASFHNTLNAFVPLAKRLGCDAIWVRATSKSLPRENKLGIAWGRNHGWSQVVSTEKDTLPDRPTKVSAVQN